jgi:sugar phosphate permease
MTVVVLTLAVGINGAVNGGCITNHVDISPNHAGILMGITNTAANTCGIVAPFVAGLLTNEEATLDRWQIVFFIAAGVYVFNNLIYLLFASGSEQSWNRGEDKSSQNKSIENMKETEKEETGKGSVNWVCVNEVTQEMNGEKEESL